MRYISVVNSNKTIWIVDVVLRVKHTELTAFQFSLHTAQFMAFNTFFNNFNTFISIEVNHLCTAFNRQIFLFLIQFFKQAKTHFSVLIFKEQLNSIFDKSPDN